MRALPAILRKEDKMKNAEHLKFKIYRILLVIVFVIGVGIIAIYPFDNRNLLLKFETDKGEFTELETNIDIANRSCR